MILDLISLFVSFLCLLIFIMMIGSFKYNRRINIPFVIIILFVGIQRFQSSTSNLKLLESPSMKLTELKSSSGNNIFTSKVSLL